MQTHSTRKTYLTEISVDVGTGSDANPVLHETIYRDLSLIVTHINFKALTVTVFDTQDAPLYSFTLDEAAISSTDANGYTVPSGKALINYLTEQNPGAVIPRGFYLRFAYVLGDTDSTVAYTRNIVIDYLSSEAHVMASILTLLKTGSDDLQNIAAMLTSIGSDPYTVTGVSLPLV